MACGTMPTRTTTRVTIPVNRLDPTHTTCKLQVVSSVVLTYWYGDHDDVTQHRRSAPTRRSSALFIRSHQQDLGNHTNE